MTAPGNYHALSIGEKQRAQREAIREPGVRCPGCGWQLEVASLLPHVREGRCPGRRGSPHPAARWVSRSESRALGCSGATLTRLTQAGLVRARGPYKSRQYLLADLVLELAQREIAKRLPVAGNRTSAGRTVRRPDTTPTCGSLPGVTGDAR
jgi:hypothetical protein